MSNPNHESKKLSLFERREKRPRLMRARSKAGRTPMSYRRAASNHVDAHHTASLTHCPGCRHRISAAQSSRTPLIKDIVLSPQTCVTDV